MHKSWVNKKFHAPNDVSGRQGGRSEFGLQCVSTTVMQKSNSTTADAKTLNSEQAISVV